MIRPEEGGFTQADEAYMRLALRLADEAAAEGEVPVGAVLVRDGEVAGTSLPAATGGKRCGTRFAMPRSRPSIRPAAA